MATPSNQILNKDELLNKLGSYSTYPPNVPNKSEISSCWPNTYFTISGTNVIPNNGEIWPTKTLKYGTSLYGAYSSSNYATVNFRDSNWESENSYVYSSNCKAYISDSYANYHYYYMENGSSNIKYYYINSYTGGIQTGYYDPPYFSYNSSSVSLNTSYGNTSTAGYSSNVNVSTISRYEYDVNGDVAGSSSQVSVSYNNGTATFTRQSYNANYPMIVITSGDNNVSDNILVYPPWNISGTDITNVSSDGATVTPTVTTNMGEYSLSSNKAWATITGNNVIVAANTETATRTATITATGRVSGTWRAIEYDSGNVSGTFAITQNAYVPPVTYLYVLVSKSAPSTFYLSTTSTVYTPLSSGAPARITIMGVKVQTQAVIGAQVYTGSGSINTRSNTGLVRWVPNIPSGESIVSINDYGSVTATLSSEYVLDSTVHFLNSI